jgi:hypothetical protein
MMEPVSLTGGGKSMLCCQQRWNMYLVKQQQDNQALPKEDFL